MLNDLRITVLIENSSRSSDLKTEHGLSYYIESGKTKLLFDTGSSRDLLFNADKLKLNLEQIKQVIISHGHYDHTGGLSHLINKIIFIHPLAFIPKYKKSGDRYSYIGLPESKKYYQDHCGHKFKEISKPTEIVKDFFIIPVADANIPDNNFFIKKASMFSPDKFLDELVLVIDSKKGLILISGCSHNGIINIIEQVKNHFTGKKIYALLAGMHLSKTPDDQVAVIAAQLNNKEISNIGVSHCSGSLVTSKLKNAFDFNTGNVFTLDNKQ